MFTFKSNVTATAIAIGIVGFLGLEAYGFYSIHSLLDTRLTQVGNGIESVRASNAAIASLIQSQTTSKDPGSTKTKDVKPAAGNQRIVVNPRVAARLQKILPAGTNLNEASAGFKTEGQFISAVCVSKDLGIPFARLKAKVTGNHPVSIEAAIRDLRPDLSKAKAKAEVEKGQRQAIEIAKLGGKSGSSLT
jgi:hypothetical protein